jgi:hypothetical protein
MSFRCDGLHPGEFASLSQAEQVLSLSRGRPQQPRPPKVRLPTAVRCWSESIGTLTMASWSGRESRRLPGHHDLADPAAEPADGRPGDQSLQAKALVLGGTGDATSIPRS